MKTEFILLISLLGLAGCQTAPVPAVAPLPLAPMPAPAGVRVPEVVKTYTLGAYIDPADPTLRHEAHTVQRIVTPAHWNLAPTVSNQATTPVAAVEPVTMNKVPAATPPATVTMVQTALADAVLTEPAPDSEPAITPNADGLIDLTAPAGTDGAEANPFAVRKLPADAVREITLQVSGVIAGPKPCAVINERLFEPGAVIEGFTVARIEAAAVVVTWGGHRLRLPLSDKPARVRLTF